MRAFGVVVVALLLSACGSSQAPAFTPQGALQWALEHGQLRFAPCGKAAVATVGAGETLELEAWSVTVEVKAEQKCKESTTTNGNDGDPK